MKILNLYAGIGGNRKLWGDEHEITSVEYNQDIADVYKHYFPNDEMVVTDAHQYLLDHFKEYDFIWTSPPCQSHTVLNTMLNKNGINRYPDMTLYQQIILLNNWFYGKFVVENVKPYYDPLIRHNVELDRHLFWTNIKTIGYSVKNKRQVHTSIQGKSVVYGYDLSEFKLDNKGQVLKNMVNPEIGLHFLNRANEIQSENDITEQKLF